MTYPELKTSGLFFFISVRRLIYSDQLHVDNKLRVSLAHRRSKTVSFTETYFKPEYVNFSIKYCCMLEVRFSQLHYFHVAMLFSGAKSVQYDDYEEKENEPR